MERFAQKAAQALNQVLENPITVTDLEIPPDPKMGDFALPCFKLSKSYKLGPPQTAQKIAADLQAKGAVPREIVVEAAGPYVNFKVAPEAVLGTLLQDLLHGSGLGTYGQLPAGTRGRWVLEYSSPNVAKIFNIYHLRPTVLGAALDRIGRFRGFDVVSINHLGDWGTQYGMNMVAYRRFGHELPKEPRIDDLVALYVKVNKLAAEDPAVADEAREAFLKLEQGDPEVVQYWQKSLDISLKEFKRIYARLGISFDYYWGESHYKDYLQPLLKDLRERGLMIESEGAWVVPVTDENGKELVPCIMLKSDGATIYATRDVAAALYRHEKFDFERMTYIVGGEQKLHFQQVFGVLRKMGQGFVGKCEHVPTGLYRFKDAKMSTRKGNFISFEEVLGQARDKVAEIMDARATGEGATASLSPSEREAVIEAIAVGALVFNDLHTDPARDVEFDVSRVVDFEGETGPYLQYAHTRCASILRKAREKGALSGDVTFDPAVIARLKAPEEVQLVKTLGRLPLHLERTLRYGKASQLAHYLIDVVREFGAFYRECQVLGDDPELTRARLMLVEATRRLLARGLGLLGVPLPARM